MTRPPALTEAQRREVARRYRAGESIRQIADTFGVGYGTVHEVLVLRDVPRRARGGNQRAGRPGLAGQHDAVAADYRAGMSIEQIAAARHVALNTVRRSLIISGVPRRPPPGRPQGGSDG